MAELAPLAAIHAHEADARAIFEHDENMLAKADEVVALSRAWGWGWTPPERENVRRAYLSFRKFAESLPRDRFVPIRGDRATLELGETRLDAWHCPGHTEGLVCFHLAAAGGGGGVLFANDHILERITPNPTVYIPPYRGLRTGLADYVESLRRVRGLPAERVLPGHGRSFRGLAARADTILAHHDERREKIRRAVAAGAREAAGGGRTVLALVLELWTKLDPGDYYLACREVNGHLDLLIAEGSVEERMSPEGVALYTPRA